MTSDADFYERSIDWPDAFWTEQAKLIDWFTPPTRVCNYDNPPFAHWFEGGTTNLCHNAVDRHLATRGGQAALIYVHCVVLGGFASGALASRIEDATPRVIVGAAAG